MKGVDFMAMKFQSTFRTGATSIRLVRVQFTAYFNPHSHKGATLAMISKVSIVEISIHASI